MVHQEVFRFGSLNPLHSSSSAVQYQIRSSLHFPLWRRNRRIAVCLLLTVSARRLISEIVRLLFLENLFENEETSEFAIETFFAHCVPLEVCANCNVQYEFARKVWWDKQWLGAAKPFFLAVVD